MKCISVIVLISCFAASISFGRVVTAKKIKIMPRSALNESGLSSAFLADKINHWQKVDQTLLENAKYESKTGNFRVESGKEEPDSGDVARYRFFIIKNTGKKEPLTKDPISGVDVIADGKFLILEPLTLVDTTNWERIDLAKAAHINPYFSVLLYSAKSNKLLVAQFDCAYDCHDDDKATVWEIGF